MRNLKFHEKKLLKKVNLEEWDKTNTKREQLVTTKYKLHNRETYMVYNRIVGKIRKLTESLARLDDTNVTKKYLTNKMLNKLHELGVIPEKKLSNCIKVTVSDFCKRRLPVVIAQLKMVENYQDADRFVQHGHFKIGTKVVRDPETLIDVNMAQYIKWADKSKIREKLAEINGTYDDYDNL
ncbi:IMP3 [Enterospora canceri]|uniref:IMP3 n=1 Tax=Enterospora canceri TaxID=1081671 RepID=A0A1Y1S9B0_9MICR|nr:IMP3 [Enterospora canceri]